MKPVAALSVLIDILVEFALTAAGWHRSGRHPWRKRRTSMPPQTPALTAQTANVGNAPAKPSDAEPRKLIDRAGKATNPRRPQFWACSTKRDPPISFDDVASDAEKSVARLIYPSDSLGQEIIRRQIRSAASELGGPNPSPIEAMLARRAALCWISVNWSESMHTNAVNEGTTFAKSDHYQRRIDRAHRRLLSSLKALASVRRVPLTAVQVNVQSINLASTARRA